MLRLHLLNGLLLSDFPGELLLLARLLVFTQDNLELTLQGLVFGTPILNTGEEFVVLLDELVVERRELNALLLEIIAVLVEIRIDLELVGHLVVVLAEIADVDLLVGVGGLE